MDVFVPGFSREIEPVGGRFIIHTHGFSVRNPLMTVGVGKPEIHSVGLQAGNSSRISMLAELLLLQDVSTFCS